MTTLWVWGTGWVTATLVSRQRASGLDRCAYSGGPAPEVRGRLFVPMAGPWWLEGEACRSAEGSVWGDLCERPTHGRGPRHGQAYAARPGTSCAAGDIFVRAGTFDAVGDGNPVPERVGCPRLERTAPGRAECPRLWWRHGRLRMQWRRAICASPAGPQRGTASSPA